MLKVFSTSAMLAKRALVARAKELRPEVWRSLSRFCFENLSSGLVYSSYFFTRFVVGISSTASEVGIKPKGIW